MLSAPRVIIQGGSRKALAAGGKVGSTECNLEICTASHAPDPAPVAGLSLQRASHCKILLMSLWNNKLIDEKII